MAIQRSGRVPEDDTGGTTSGAGTAGDDRGVVQAFDEIGRPVELPVGRWAAEVYPMLVAQNWSNADQLALLVGRAIELGEAERAVQGADRLVDIDADRERAFLVHAALHRALGDLDTAEETLDTYVEGAGSSARVVAALAGIYAERGELDEARLLLRRSLTLDPNQPDAVATWVDWARRDAVDATSGATAGNGAVGDADAQRAAVRSALEEIATEAHAWRAPMMLGALDAAGGDIDAALGRYDAALVVADMDDTADTTDLLLQVSGDLGNAGRTADAVDRVAGRYSPERHPVEVGLNLARALLATGRVDDARAVIEPIVRNAAPMVPEDVTAVERAVVEAVQTDRQNALAEAGTSIGFLTVDGPMWQSGLAAPTWVIPPVADADAGDDGDDGDDTGLVVVMALADLTDGDGDARVLGALTRGAPLLWSDVLSQRYGARLRTVVPIVPGLGPVSVPEPWNVDQLVAGSPAGEARWLVVGSLHGTTAEPTVSVQVYDRVPGTPDASQPELLGSFELDGHDAPGLRGAQRIAELLDAAGVPEAVASSDWVAPPDELEERYRTALDDGCILAMAAEGVTPTDAVWGLSDTLRNCFSLSEELPDSVATHGMAVSNVFSAVHKDLPGAQPFLQVLFRRHSDADERPGVPARTLLSPLVLRSVGDTDGFDAVVASDVVRDRVEDDERYARWVAQFSGGGAAG